MLTWLKPVARTPSRPRAYCEKSDDCNPPARAPCRGHVAAIQSVWASREERDAYLPDPVELDRGRDQGWHAFSTRRGHSAGPLTEPVHTQRGSDWQAAADRLIARVDVTARETEAGFPHYAEPETGRWV